MKKIGIVGGLSPVATEFYYKKLTYNRPQKFPNYPDIIVYSLNQEGLKTFVQLAKYGEPYEKMKEDEFRKPINILIKALNALNNIGADLALISSNTPHLLFDEVKKKSDIPLINLIDEVAKRVKEKDLKKVGLLGTKLVMNEGFYQKKFSEYGIEITIPPQEEQNYIQQKLGGELVFGKVDKETDQNFVDIVNRMKKKEDIEAIILGCTDLPFLPSLNDETFDLPTLDTVEIHCSSALQIAIEE